jgi:membrane protein implicated in regulation of membrane protease activity
MEASETADESTDEVAAFRKEVEEEVVFEEATLKKLSKSRKRDSLGHILAVCLIAILIILIFTRPYFFLLWLIVGILLYSYNFIIILIPTTTKRIRPYEKGILRNLDTDHKWLAIKLLLKKKRLAIEIGLTVFLGGMVPLALSFSIIFGIGLFFALNFGFLIHLIDWQVAFVIASQIVFILLFYMTMVALEPQAQGIMRIALTYKERIGEARSRGRMALITIVMFIIALVMLITMISLGAILFPGFTLVTTLNALRIPEGIDIPVIFFVILAQLVVMRHFQGVASRRMAVGLLHKRIERLKGEVLAPLEAWTKEEKHVDEKGHDSQFRAIKKNYYSIAIYDIIEQDIFGLLPIYLVAPRLRYVLNDKVLSFFGG